jgi:hypothetical protein
MSSSPCNGNTNDHDDNRKLRLEQEGLFLFLSKQ